MRSTIRQFLYFRQHRNAVSLQCAFDLVTGPKYTIEHVTQHTSAESKEHSPRGADNKNEQAPRMAGGARTRSPRNQACLRDRVRLLLYRFRVALHKAVIQRAISLSGALKITQLDLGLIGRLRYRNLFLQIRVDGVGPRFGNLIIAPIRLRDATEFVENDLANFAHLVA